MTFISLPEAEDTLVSIVKPFLMIPPFDGTVVKDNISRSAYNMARTVPFDVKTRSTIRRLKNMDSSFLG